MNELKKDDLVLVWNYPNDIKYLRYFSHFNNDSIVVYTKGATSKTAYSTKEYTDFELVNQETGETLGKQYPVDTKIIVTINYKENKGYLHKVLEDGSCEYYVNGKTSWNQSGLLISKCWRLAEDV